MINDDLDSCWESVDSIGSIDSESSFLYDGEEYILSEIIKETQKYVDLNKNESEFLKEILYLEYKENYFIKIHKKLLHPNKFTHLSCFVCCTINECNIYSFKECYTCNMRYNSYYLYYSDYPNYVKYS